jgi:hypothetical protein
MAPLDAVKALEHYQATHENPAACESLELERLLEARERKLIYLLDGNSRLTAQVVYRCSKVDLKTTYCTGFSADDSAHPFSAGIHPITAHLSADPSIVCLRKGFELVAVYKLQMKFANGTVFIPKPETQHALIAIFKSPGQWGFRKAIWYF